MRFTFYGLMSLGIVLLSVYLGGALVLSSVTPSSSGDWLVEGRWVVLTAERYRPGTVTHFDFRSMEPSRNAGFFLLAGEDTFVAVFDRPGCMLEHRAAQADLYNPCTQRAYPIAAVLAGSAQGPDLVLLPLSLEGESIRVDVSGVLGGS